MQRPACRRVGGFRFILSALALIVVAAIPQRLAAQLSVGGYLGGEFDNQNHWLLYGADVRIPLASAPSTPIIGQARYTYHPGGDGFSISQLDANLLLPLQLAHPTQFFPYVGAGAAWVHESADAFSENKVGLNLITGADVDFSPGSAMFGIVQTQYTVVRDFPNSYTLVLGLGFHLGSTKKR